MDTSNNSISCERRSTCCLSSISFPFCGHSIVKTDVFSILFTNNQSIIRIKQKMNRWCLTNFVVTFSFFFVSLLVSPLINDSVPTEFSLECPIIKIGQEYFEDVQSTWDIRNDHRDLWKQSHSYQMWRHIKNALDHVRFRRVFFVDDKVCLNEKWCQNHNC